MFWIFLMLVVALIVVKLVKISLCWVPYGISYEPFPRYLYRLLWLTNARVIPELMRRDVQYYGSVYGSYRGTTPTLVVSDVKFAKEGQL